MPINETYSHKDLSGQTFLDRDPDEFSNTEIVGTCFAQEAEYNANASHSGSTGHVDTSVDVFPPGMHGVTFTRCNLDNCKVPGPPTTIDSRSSHRKIRVMNDAEDWVLGANNKPAEPVNKRLFVKHGLSVDPVDIPAERNMVSATRRAKVGE